MRYTSFEAALAAMRQMNLTKGHPPAAVYWVPNGAYYIVIRAWSHPLPLTLAEFVV